MRAETKQLRQRLKTEQEQRKKYWDIAKRREEELTVYKEQLINTGKELQAEKDMHAKTQVSLQLKAERLKITEKELKKATTKWNESTNLGPSPAKKKKYEQPTATVTEEELQKSGKDAILKKLKKENIVAFPEKDKVDLSSMSRIDQLKYNSNAFKEQKLKEKKKVMF